MLKPAQRQVLLYCAAGYTAPATAAVLPYAEATIRDYRRG